MESTNALLKSSDPKYEVQIKNFLKRFFEYLVRNFEKLELIRRQLLSKKCFIRGMKLFIPVSKSLFELISQDPNQEYITIDQFIETLYILYGGDEEKLLELIFKLLDVDHDKILQTENIAYILSFVPLKEFEQQNILKMGKSLEAFPNKTYPDNQELEQCLVKFFGTQNQITFQIFKNEFNVNEKFHALIDTSIKHFTLKIPCTILIMNMLQEKKIIEKFQLKGKEANNVNAIDQQIGKNQNFIKLNKKGNEQDKKVNATKLESQLEEEKKESALDSLYNRQNLQELIQSDKKIPSELEAFIKINKVKIEDSPQKMISVKERNQYNDAMIDGNLELQVDDIFQTKMENFDRDDSQEIPNQVEVILHLQDKKYLECLMVFIENCLLLFENENKDNLLILHYLNSSSVSLTKYKIKGENNEKIIKHGIKISFNENSYRMHFNTLECATKWNNFLVEQAKKNTLEEFVILGVKIDEGAFGTVYQGLLKNQNQKVAVKKIKKDKIKNIHYEIQLMQEIQILEKLAHQNIVSFMMFIDTQNDYYIVMEYVKGQDLQKFLNEKLGVITEKEALKLFYQVALGVQYLHQNGIMHRDIKAENILATKIAQNNVHLKIIDFGLSIFLSKKQTSNEKAGSEVYMAPEVIQQNDYNFKADLWSLGVLLHKMISTDFPFIKNKKIDYNQELFQDQLWKSVRPQTIKIIKKLLRKNPGERLTIDELVLLIKKSITRQ